jgi:hypothetical protein
VVTPLGYLKSGAYMKNAVWLFGILVLGVILFGCNDNKISKEPALKFLQGIQDGNKSKMYEAANLTTDFVNDSREKLIYPDKYKQTEQQRKDSEHGLKISGEIDFFSSKLKKMFPKSASFLITKSKTKDAAGDTQNAVHFVKVTYSNKDEAMIDKTKRPVKEMVLHLQQATRTIQGSPIHEFSFNSEDFEKIADKNFEVLSYFQ